MGCFLLPAIAIFAALLMLKRRQRRAPILKTVLLSFFIAFIVGGWFYINLYNRYGSVKTYIIYARPTFSFSNQPSKFYFDLSLDRLFKDPIRRAFPNQFLPLFYSEIWGDYWCYFLVFGKHIPSGRYISGKELRNLTWGRSPPPEFETNRYEIGKYLGRVNIVSLFPSLLLFAGVILGTIYFIKFAIKNLPNDGMAMSSLPYLAVVTSFAGFFWYLIMYPMPGKGDTIKATYIIQIFPFIAILAGELLEIIKKSSFRIYWILLTVLIITILHNFPTFITHYTSW
jgi:hypothetical protein